MYISFSMAPKKFIFVYYAGQLGVSITMPKKRQLNESGTNNVSTSRLPRGAETVIQTIDSQLDAHSDTGTVDCKVDQSSLIDAIPYARLLADIMPPRGASQHEIPLVPWEYEERLCESASRRQRRHVSWIPVVSAF